ncbi:MAG: hypothetical protein K6F32_03480 [Bacilli bacterium]|nr:hypothetical protein [Bacilli bacterium]
MIYEGVWGDISNFSIVDALVVSLIAILIVFLVLIVVILVTTGVEKGVSYTLGKISIMPRKENEILERDEDAVAALIAATIEFHKETGKSPRVKSITEIED